MNQQSKEKRDIKISALTWTLPDDVEIGRQYTKGPKPTEESIKRLAHMIQLYDKGEKISNIARLYRLSRQRIHSLLKDHISSKQISI